MTTHDDDRPGDDGVLQSGVNGKPNQRRNRMAVGAVSLAALLGAGTYLVTSHVVDHDNPVSTGDANVLAPIVSSASPDDSTAAPPSTPSSPTPSTSVSGSPKPSKVK